jgi:hypothetical protein
VGEEDWCAGEADCIAAGVVVKKEVGRVLFPGFKTNLNVPGGASGKFDAAATSAAAIAGEFDGKLELSVDELSGKWEYSAGLAMSVGNWYGYPKEFLKSLRTRTSLMLDKILN